MNSIRILIWVVFTGFMTANVNAQTFPVKLDNSEVQSIQSQILNETIHLYISVPLSYHERNKSYPVLYLTDADDFMLMASEISRLMSVDKQIPELIVVGFAYKAHITKPGNKRNRDYSPYTDVNFAGSGHAIEFMSSVQKELIPFIDSKYRTVKNENTFFGTSLGALFGTSMLLRTDGIFKRYVLSSPSLWWADKEIFKDEAKCFSQKKELSAEVFFSVGSLEDKHLMIEPLSEFVEVLNTRKYKGLHYQLQILEGETHLSAGPAAMIKGLRAVFKDFKIY